MMGGLLTWSGRLLAPSWCLLLLLLACRACLITAARACACRGDATQFKEVAVAQDTRPNTYGIMPFYLLQDLGVWDVLCCCSRLAQHSDPRLLLLGGVLRICGLLKTMQQFRPDARVVHSCMQQCV
jgi:hypothetical protein